MARAALPGRLNWQLTRVVELRRETDHTTTLILDAPQWPGHLAGQHVDVRLTAPDGYQAQRSYSIASAPEDEHLMLTVEVLPDGEVSPYLGGELRVGDELELRGPIGGYFVWTADRPEPLQVIAGGSGIVPLRAMLRHREAAEATTPASLLYSARTADDLIYTDELRAWQADGVDVSVTLTREAPAGWSGRRGRVDAAMVAAAVPPVAERPAIYLCGPSGFVEHVSALLVERGHPADAIRIERFGPS